MDFERNVLNKMKQNEIHATVSKEKMHKIFLNFEKNYRK
jgi:hypothetical protein